MSGEDLVAEEEGVDGGRLGRGPGDVETRGAIGNDREWSRTWDICG